MTRDSPDIYSQSGNCHKITAMITVTYLLQAKMSTMTTDTYIIQTSVGIDLQVLGVESQVVMYKHFAQTLKITANFHSKMSSSRHKLGTGGVQLSNPPQFHSCIRQTRYHHECLLSYVHTNVIQYCHSCIIKQITLYLRNK